MRNRAIALKEGSTLGMDAEPSTSEELHSVTDFVCFMNSFIFKT